MLAAVLAVAETTLTFTMPDTIPAEGRCDSSLGIPEQGTLGARLERLRNGEFAWYVVDSLSGRTPGARESLVVDLTGCAPCAYRVWTTDAAGNVSWCSSRVLNLWEGVEPVGVGDRPAFQLARVTPMPVRHLAVVEFELAIAGDAELELYDLAGRQVRVLTRGGLAAGRHLALLDAGSVPPGLYLLRLRAGDRQAVRRLVVMR